MVDLVLNIALVVGIDLFFGLEADLFLSFGVDEDDDRVMNRLSRH